MIKLKANPNSKSSVFELSKTDLGCECGPVKVCASKVSYPDTETLVSLEIVDYEGMTKTIPITSTSVDGIKSEIVAFLSANGYIVNMSDINITLVGGNAIIEIVAESNYLTFTSVTTSVGTVAFALKCTKVRKCTFKTLTTGGTDLPFDFNGTVTPVTFAYGTQTAADVLAIIQPLAVGAESVVVKDDTENGAFVIEIVALGTSVISLDSKAFDKCDCTMAYVGEDGQLDPLPTVKKVKAASATVAADTKTNK